jgi:hypothetical protein
LVAEVEEDNGEPIGGKTLGEGWRPICVTPENPVALTMTGQAVGRASG